MKKLRYLQTGGGHCPGYLKQKALEYCLWGISRLYVVSQSEICDEVYSYMYDVFDTW